LPREHHTISSLIRAVALLLTALTGFSGLAYEVAWQRYLATLLGAHSEATAAVLAIFLGGLSAGYWVFGAVTRALVMRSRATGRPPPLLLCYGAVEIAIGVYAVLFPWLFRAAQQVSLWLPTGGGLLAFAADVLLAAALIGPPSVLMGATIPLLTQALARSLADATRLHALVYATNTAGAFVGALAAGFALVPKLGLDGVATSMGMINLGAGSLFALMGARRRDVVPLDEIAASEREGGGTGAYAAAALLVGFGSMTCQAILIRVGGLTLGSSEFTFAMVVAAFVFSIAVGSLAVSLVPRVGRPVLPAALWALALAFGFLYLHVEDAPYWGHLLRTFFTSRPETFHVYYAAAFLATLLAIGPAAALSGSALPLIFDAVREEMGDLGAKAGRLYSQNTIGSLLGALIGGYALLFWLDMHHVFRVALAAFALAAALVTAHRYRGGGLVATAALFVPALIALVVLPSWDPGRLTAGFFRDREPLFWTFGGPAAVPRFETAFYDDDPTATVAVMPTPGDSVSIVVNGKSDGNTAADLDTMALAALLPALFAERAERAFVIGLGTGITAGFLAEVSTMQSVTVAEISSGVLAAAPLFDFANNGASHNPKIEHVRSDAYRALLRTQQRFDVIVSEPSNPWVAGTEMLFSREFLRAAREHLEAGGVYVQWFHLYETNNRSVQLVLQNFAEVFDQVALWRSQGTDVLLIGLREPTRAFDLPRIDQRFARPDLHAAFARIGIQVLPQLLVHEGLPLGVLHAAGPTGLPPHTLYHPRLSYEAGRGFFVGSNARLPILGYGQPAQLGYEHSVLRRYLDRFEGGVPEEVWDAMIRRACRTTLPHCGTLVAAWSRGKSSDDVRARIDDLRRRGTQLEARLDLVPLLRFFYGEQVDAAATSPDDIQRQQSIYFDRYYHALPFLPRTIVALWQHCHQSEAAGPACDRGLREAEHFVTTRRLPPAWVAAQR
jgi:predicted membrane-bound spermidine synthase